MNRIRLLIVDDHEVVRVGLRTLLDRADNIEVVGEAATGEEGLRECRQLLPDVVLLDLRLSDGDGFTVCREIQELERDVRVLVLSSYADDESVMQAISAGADGYVLKEIDRAQLIGAIEKVAAGQSVLDPAVTGRIFRKLQNVGEGQTENRLSLLSAQERRVLALVAQGKTNKEVAAVMGLSDKTVKNYFSTILEKLQVARRSQAAAYFVQHSGALR